MVCSASIEDDLMAPGLARYMFIKHLYWHATVAMMVYDQSDTWYE